MTNLEAVNLLLNISIKKEKAYHPGYADTVEYARSSRAHFAGVNVDDYLKMFTRREDNELFSQRRDITAHVNKSFGAMLDRPFSKVPRSNYTRVLSFDGDENGQRVGEFERQVLSGFTNKGLDQYVFDRCRYFSKYDPNTFIVVEFAPFDSTRERAKPYPFEVTADMAVDFMYNVHGDLEYLAVRQVQMKMDGDNQKEFERLTLYRPMQTVVLQELTKEELKQFPAKPSKTSAITEEPQDGQLVHADNNKYFEVVIPLPHGLDRTPAIRVGFQENPEDDGKTRVGIFDAALPYARKVVKINSELDLTSALLAFPVSVRHEEQCGEVGCNSGKLPDGTDCAVCHGTGYKKRPTSAAEEIVLPLPDRGEDMFDVTKILHYVYPPPESVKLQLELMQYNIIQGRESVFNSEMFNKQETAQTATYHGIQLQSVYDTLYPYAQNLARIWGFLARACKEFTGFSGAMTAKLVFPHDFRFETADDLFNELKMARDSGAGTDTTALIQTRIMERLLIDDEEELKRWRIDDQYNPFRGMSEAQIIMMMSSDLVPKWKKVWYSNRTDIMADILFKYPDFYNMENSKRRAIIMQAVADLQKALNDEMPVLTLPGIGDNEPQPQPNE